MALRIHHNSIGFGDGCVIARYEVYMDARRSEWDEQFRCKTKAQAEQDFVAASELACEQPARYRFVRLIDRSNGHVIAEFNVNNWLLQNASTSI